VLTPYPEPAVATELRAELAKRQDADKALWGIWCLAMDLSADDPAWRVQATIDAIRRLAEKGRQG